MAIKNKISKYFAIRIFLIPLLIYLFLVLPINGITFLRNAPELYKKYKNLTAIDTIINNEIITDTIAKIKSEERDSISDTLEIASVIKADADDDNGLVLNFGDDKKNVGFNFSNEKPDKKIHKGDESITGWVILLGLIAGLTFNFPFRIYFRRKRKNKPISEKLSKYCKKYLQYTPLINCLLFVTGFLVIHIHSIYLINSSHFTDDLERNLFKNWFYISFISSILTVLFVYLWQKYRLEFKYLEHAYEESELRKNVYKTSKSHSLKLRLWLITTMTTVLPLVIVLFYAYISVSTVKDLGLTSISKDQLHILLGKFYTLIENINGTSDFDSFQDLPFVSTIDVFLAFAGIHTSIFVAIIYIFFVVNWTNKSITLPVRELMINMKKTGAGEHNYFIPVRTNDEMGALTEGYNDMTQKISSYIEEISEMNRDLEQKVKDRTSEIVLQKEEIETQRDEILEKNEELVQQKEEIISQKDEIESQKKIVDEQNRNITDSIRYALRIQKTILPPDEYIKQLLPDSFIFYKPKDIVSGDFYWLTEKNNDIIFSAIDCTGHGVPGALMSIVAHNLLNRAMREGNANKPSDILNFISRELYKNFQGQNQGFSVRDGMDLAVCMLNKTKNKIQFSGIHSPLYLIRDKKLQIFKSDYIPLGDLSNEDFTEYINYEISLQKGDMIYIFSDGIIDQFGGRNKKRYMTKNLKETLLEIHSLQVQEQHEMLARIFDYWRGKFAQTDDVLVIGVRI